MHSKHELRKIVKNLLQNQKKISDFTNTCTELLKLTEFKNAHVIAGYIPFQQEASPIPFLTESLNEHKIIAIPKIISTSMDFFDCNKNTSFKENSYGILEPQNVPKIENFENAIFIVPGLSFSKDGKRLGRGKGYYDGFFANLFSKTENKCTLIGFCNSIQLFDDIPIEAHDILMDYVATEQGIIRCKK